MRYMKWIGPAAAVLLIISSFIPWVFIESKNIIISGVDATGTNFGKPGYFHLFLTILFLLCHFIPRIWAKRTNLFITALNMGWAIKNYFMISACMGGECPSKKAGIFLVPLASLLMILSALFPDMKLPEEKKGDHL
ncbi:MAG: hypothetical protein ACRDEB_08765 [Chitinophagaceae bacterium]